ncbi:MAG: hypothetical protein QOG64_2725 [Acidimicrobiaceae bacterium]|nr:hypothetical protein [Acidimicrobiaceae bacterium]
MALLVLAAHARRKGWAVRVIDEHFEPIPDERVDLLAISVWTPTAPRAYEIAQTYRARGVPVLLGGVHASLLPGEALAHADSVVCGEADAIFGEILDDVAAGRLRPLYQGSWHGMDAVPTVDEWADIVAGWPLLRYAPGNTLQTTRGCRFNCDFCSVIRINGRGSRHRDPERVVEELRVLKRIGQHVGDFTYVFFLDDDLAADLEYTEALCEAIVRSGVRITWGAQASIGLARTPPLVDLAVRAGCRVLFTGFESVSRESLIECNKKNRPGEYGELIANLHRRGVAVEGGFILGFDHDDATVFENTADFADRIGCDTAHFSILTPYPGTHTFARMVAEDRVTSFDWNRYDLYQVVFEPARMPAADLQAGLATTYRRFYAASARRRRFVAHRRDVRFRLALGATGRDYARVYRNPVRSTSRFEPSADDIAQLTRTSGAPAQEAVHVAMTGLLRTPTGSRS